MDGLNDMLEIKFERVIKGYIEDEAVDKGISIHQFVNGVVKQYLIERLRGEKNGFRIKR